MNAGLKKQLESAKKASYQLSSSSTEQRNAALQALIKHLQKGKLAILKANRKDVAKKNKDDALVDRLLLTEKRIDAICADIKAIIGLPDPLNISFDKADRPSGLRLKKVTVPLGTIAIVYESRPNVTVDISSLCIKSGNTVILRGGSDAYATNQVLAKLIQAALKDASLDPHGVQLM
ncbi:MAG: hypothetical protein Q8P95_00215, partial [bacterium]|nr:hypothetical protein [bacterium]